MNKGKHDIKKCKRKRRTDRETIQKQKREEIKPKQRKNRRGEK
jgi:hypothetical protein